MPVNTVNHHRTHVFGARNVYILRIFFCVKSKNTKGGSWLQAARLAARYKFAQGFFMILFVRVLRELLVFGLAHFVSMMGISVCPMWCGSLLSKVDISGRHKWISNGITPLDGIAFGCDAGRMRRTLAVRIKSRDRLCNYVPREVDLRLSKHSLGAQIGRGNKVRNLLKNRLTWCGAD